MNKMLNVLIVLAALLCSLEVPVFAQTDPCIGWSTGIVKPFQPPYSDATCEYQTYSFGSYTCKVFLCAPPAGPKEIRSKCPECSNPISLNAGNVYIEENDVRIPGLAGGLTFSRTWNSTWPLTQTALQIGSFGLNWRSTYEERIFAGGDNFTKYARGDGSFWSFGGGGPLYPLAPANITASLTTDSPPTKWTLTFQNGERRVFDFVSGSLTAIIDRNGNTTQLTYDGINRLVTVTDPGGRHLYFGYQNNSSYLITSVTSDVGISLSYAYDSQGRLVQVTEPDQTTLTYQYNVNSMITAVIDSNGKVLESHTYDYCSRGTSGARAGGVESVTLSYPAPVCPGTITLSLSIEP